MRQERRPTPQRRRSSRRPIKKRLTTRSLRLVSFVLSKRRRSQLAEDAAAARAAGRSVAVAFAGVAIYNVVGVFDIVSTIAAIELGAAEEANPLMRAIMDNHGSAWILAKLLLQFIISAMVLWFPHRVVLTIFFVAVAANALIVANNFRIAFGL